MTIADGDDNDDKDYEQSLDYTRECGRDQGKFQLRPHDDADDADGDVDSGDNNDDEDYERCVDDTREYCTDWGMFQLRPHDDEDQDANT